MNQQQVDRLMQPRYVQVEMKWWEDRKIEEMPDHFRINPNMVDMEEEDKAAVYKAYKWNVDKDGFVYHHEWANFGGILIENLLPAAEEEYLTYINSKRKGD